VTWPRGRDSSWRVHLSVQSHQVLPMPLDPHAIQIHSDGSRYENPGGIAGCAAIVHYPDHLNLPDEQIVDFGCSESSNNRKELMACIKALEWVRVHQPWPDVTRLRIPSTNESCTFRVILRSVLPDSESLEQSSLKRATGCVRTLREH
jgi:hypothetical protein